MPGSLGLTQRVTRGTKMIWMVTPEIPPLRTTGGLADAVHGLSRALVKAGHCVRIITPGHTGVMDMAARDVCRKRKPAEIAPLDELTIHMGQTGHVKALVTAIDIPFSENETEGALTYYFIDSASYLSFGNRAKVYGYKDDAWRYLFFNRVVATLFEQTQLHKHKGNTLYFEPDVIHCHDWATGYIGYLLRHWNPNLPLVPLVYNVHNLGYAELISGKEFYAMTGEQNPWVYGSNGLEFYGQINPHKAAILFADRTVTVSPTYLREIISGNTPAPANNYAGFLQSLADRTVGILNGIPDEFGPDLFHERGAFPATYSPENLEGRVAARKLLQQVSGLNENPQAMILLSSGRWAEQKATDSVLEALPNLLTHIPTLQFVTIGSEAAGQGFEQGFRGLSEAFPGRVAVINFSEHLSPTLFGENLEALGMAGADAYLMPSRFEPCGLGQMKALKLGLPVIAHNTGGLADTVREGVTGILFNGATVENIFRAVQNAQHVFSTHPEKWNDMRAAAMREDFSWSSAAKIYDNVYSDLIGQYLAGLAGNFS